jgi:hypothetical protein
MDDQAVHVQFRCSLCGDVVAAVPKRHVVEEDLVCPGCGAAVKPPGIFAKIADHVRETIEEIRGRRRDGSS